MNGIHRLAILALLFSVTLASTPIFSMGWVGIDLQGKPCTGNGQGFGPFDYTNEVHRRKKLPIVESHHFTPRVRNLIAGESSYLWLDLDYTLRAFPNHHQALFALIRYATERPKEKSKWDSEIPGPECYLQRAAAFAPRDANVEFLHGLYLHRLERHEEALAHYEKGLSMQPASAEGHYNTGLLLLDMKRPNDALKHARKAYQLGYPLSGLKNKLASAGHPL